jgi:hypothetical protein
MVVYPDLTKVKIRDTESDPPHCVLSPTITVWNAVLLQWETLPGSRFISLDSRIYPKWIGETYYSFLVKKDEASNGFPGPIYLTKEKHACQSDSEC